MCVVGRWGERRVGVDVLVVGEGVVCDRGRGVRDEVG